MPARIYTISEINSEIKSLLEGNFQSVWISGEISNFKNHSSGHYYFSLKDEGGQIQSVMFRGSNRLLKFKMEDGLEVIANGRITVYEPRGNYQIVVEYLEPKGLGALQLAFEQLKKKLEAEGLFEAARKKPFPFLPKKIGIVTSPTGAAIRDLIHILQRRYPNIEILLNPVNVQGDSAANEIAQAIEELNKFEDIDLLIVGRGGGSLEDLWAFNTEVVARAIATSRLPIISAVGHEIDITISDYVADLRAPTPSAAAELAVPVKMDLEMTIQSTKMDLYQAMKRMLDILNEKLKFYRSHLKHPKTKIEELAQKLDESIDRLKLAMANHLIQIKGELAVFSKALKTLSPLAVLERGYSITYREELKKGKLNLIPIKNSSAVNQGENLQIQFAQGVIRANVLEKKD